MSQKCSRSDRDRHKPPIKYDSMRFVDSSNPGSSPARVDNPPVKYDSIRVPIDRNSLGGSRKDYSRSGSGSWRRPFRWILSGSQIKRSGSTASSIDWESPSQSGGFQVPIPKPYASPDGKMLKHLNSWHWKSLEQLQISFGDVVVCHLVKKKTLEWRKFHWLLATNEDSLVHVYPRDDNNHGVIGESKKSEISDKFMRCDIDSCKNLGNGGT
nr:PREDICTED: uncharacterized protein LOC109038169 [Bemisia tabaci]